ncbi:MAG: hypothetical protein NVS3B10_13740 [Polyangiales bacterium]
MRAAASSRIRAYALGAVAAGTVFLGAPPAAHADQVKPTGKGIVGGAFLGGEVVVFVEAIAGVRSSAAYLVGAGAGAVAGGVGGYFVEQAVSDGRIPAYMLAGGLALIVPALVVALDQTRYLPTEGAREDRPMQSLPPSDPGRPGGSSVVGAETAPSTPAAAPPSAVTPTPSTPPATPPPATPPAGGGTGGGTPSQVRSPAASGPQSLLNLGVDTADLRSATFKIGVPVPEVHPVFSASQKKQFAVESAANEVRFPMMRVTF